MSKIEEKKGNPKKSLPKKPKKILTMFDEWILMKLGQIWYQGYAEMERHELLVWFKQEKVTKLIWAEINDLWVSEFDVDNEYPLQILKCDETIPALKFVLLHKNNDYLSDITDA